jgi:hypothetical protein
MNTGCDREWTRQFIASAFTNTFINGKLKKHREQLLFDQERALLPATQPIVERQIKSENMGKRIRDLDLMIAELKQERRLTQMEMWRLMNREEPLERAEFIRACPDGECRGFLSTQWKCGICQKWACPECHEVKGLERDSEHTCNPDTLATARLLSSDTKPCPKCRTGIFKINGCDQMWCTQCHTAFNWRTGRIENNVHNPHYFEWLRRNGGVVPRAEGDIACRNDIRHDDFTRIREQLSGRHSSNQFSKVCEGFLSRLVRNTIHMRYAIMPRYETEDRVRRNEQLRVMYMRNTITEENFKITLQRNEKKIEKHREIHNVLTILLTTISDIVFRFYTHLQDVRANQWSMDILSEIDPIIDYVNECLRDTSRTYKSRMIQFSNEMRAF